MPTCDVVYIAGFSVVIECGLNEGHAGPHRNDIGTEWDQ